MQTALHQRNQAQANPGEGRQRLLTSVVGGQDKSLEFKQDLCSMFLAANIPFYKLNHPRVRAFLHKWTNQQIPDESTLRKTFLSREYERVIEGIQEKIGNRSIWLQVDTVTDECGRRKGAVLVGGMSSTDPIGPFLIHANVLPDQTANSIAILINEGLKTLWPIQTEYGKVRLLLTDGAANMKKAASALQVVIFSALLNPVFTLVIYKQK